MNVLCVQHILVIIIASYNIVTIEGMGLCAFDDLMKPSSEPKTPPWDPCFKNPCVNSGTWQVTDGEGLCECIDGYIGNTCENHDPCFQPSCLNGGTCQVTNGQASCECTEQYIGDNCENQECPINWTLFNKNCYWFVEESTTRQEADTFCNNINTNTHLVIIESEAENNFISSTFVTVIEPHFPWIKFNDMEKEGVWKWNTFPEGNFTNWRYGEPNDSGEGEDCAVIYYGGGWTDLSCSKKKHFVCEQEM